jgi:hypothetical protein
MRCMDYTQLRLSLAQDRITSIVQAIRDLLMIRLRAKRRLDQRNEQAHVSEILRLALRTACSQPVLAFLSVLRSAAFALANSINIIVERHITALICVHCAPEERAHYRYFVDEGGNVVE